MIMKILIADDEFLIREALAARILKHYSQFQDVYCAENGAEAFALIKEHDPDIVITDISMPNATGMDIIEHTRMKGLPCKFIIITGNFSYDFGGTIFILKYRNSSGSIIPFNCKS